MSVELKPCPNPWCDSTPEVLGFGVAHFAVRCAKCGIEGPRDGDREDAIAAWNNRAQASVHHTPGPWAFSWESDNRDWAIVTDVQGGIVANVNTETGPDFRSAPAERPMPAEASARLIAAAPDLLEALSGVSAIRPSNWDDDEDPEQVAAWKLVDLALAKSGGVR